MDSSSAGQLPVFMVSDFVAVANQVLEYSFNGAVIQGEIANLRLSKGKWLYFDLKDDEASVRCFAVAYQLGGVFEDGMMVRAQVVPKIHPQYGFSLTVNALRPVGEGDLKRAADLLKRKLTLEGLFDEGKKRPLPLAPTSVGLVTSGESAAYGDFIKVLKARWGGLTVTLYDTLVQGDAAPAELVRCINQASQADHEVIVITRGGGSTDDLAAFNDELVVRAVAASRTPVLAAIGHERDESLTELAADKRASTPSNAAEMLTPDKNEVRRLLKAQRRQLDQLLVANVADKRRRLDNREEKLRHLISQSIFNHQQALRLKADLLRAYNPLVALARGYILARDESGNLVRSIASLEVGSDLSLTMVDGTATTRVTKVNKAKIV